MSLDGRVPHWAVRLAAKQDTLAEYTKFSKKFGHYDITNEGKEDTKIRMSVLKGKSNLRVSPTNNFKQRLQGGSTVAPI